jgi:hypothetical protein
MLHQMPAESSSISLRSLTTGPRDTKPRIGEPAHRGALTDCRASSCQAGHCAAQGYPVEAKDIRTTWSWQLCYDTAEFGSAASGRLSTSDPEDFEVQRRSDHAIPASRQWTGTASP